jgi:hypothetical protein
MSEQEKFTLELTYAEILYVRAALQIDRHATRRAIKRGKASPDDLEATDSVFKLLDDMFFTCGLRRVASLAVRPCLLHCKVEGQENKGGQT